MKTNVKIGITVGLVAVCFFVTSKIASAIFDGLSAASDCDVLMADIGICILAAIFGFVLFGASISIRNWIKERGKTPPVAAILAMFVLGSMLSGCTKVSPGYAGIKIDQYGSNKGVQDYPLVTGMVWYNPISTSVIEYPCFVQTAVWTKSPNEGNANDEEMTFNTSEGLVVSGDISLSYQLAFDKVPAFYVKFRTDEIDAFTHGFLRNIARDAFNEIGGTYRVEDVYGVKKEELLKIVREKINSQVGQYGITVQQFGFIGALRIPEAVTEALNNKIKATQDAIRVENELRQSSAEANKTVAIADGFARSQIAKAKGEAEANILLANSITPQLIAWRHLQIQSDAVSKWDGRRPMVEGASSGLLMSLPAPSVQP